MNIFKRIAALTTAAIFSLSVMSCSNDNNNTEHLTGTAAVGKAIEGFVYVKDANGTEINVATAADGSFSIDASAMTPALMVKVVPNDGSATLYSFASATGQVVNITPMTNLALFLAANKVDLDGIYNNWGGTELTIARIVAAQKVLNANLVARMTAAGLDPTSYDFFTTAFNADSTGIDGVLDGITVVVDNSGGTYTIKDNSNTGYVFEELIDTSTIVVRDDVDTSAITIGLGADETLAAVVAKTHPSLSFSPSRGEIVSPIPLYHLATFDIAADGTLTITDAESAVVLTHPVFYKGDTTQAIWFDDVNGLSYIIPVSAILEIIQIKVGSNLHDDDLNYVRYGFYELQE